MKFVIETEVTKKSLARAEAILVPIWLKGEKLDYWGEVYELFDKDDQEAIRSYVESKKFKDGETKWLYIKGVPTFVLIAAATRFDRKRIVLLSRQLVRMAKSEGIKSVGIYLDDFERDNLAAETVTGLAAENALLAHYDFGEKFKSQPVGGWKRVERFVFLTEKTSKKIDEGIARAEMIAEAVNECRTIANYPASDMTPEGLAEAAKTALRGLKNASVTVFDEKRLKSEGMNAILAVGKGSAAAPRLVIMEYAGGKKTEKPLVFVGKGVTFDSGGLNIKTTQGMMDMYMDMSGGAGVIYGVAAIARLGLPVNVIGIVPAVENMISGLSYRQGDVIKTYGGKTIEIGNTDAEGRVILADAIEYAKTKNPALILTLATLTGAAMVALGERASALFVKNNKPLQDEIEKIGRDSGDFVWPLPLWDEFDKELEGAFADVSNAHKKHPIGGAIVGAAFLNYFAKPLPFVHIDMAPRMMTLPEEEFLAKGSAGFGVRLLSEIANQYLQIVKLVK